MNNKTPKDLITNIISLYHGARKTKFVSPKIFRGRSHSISSDVEDLFAYYLSNNIKFDQIFIDQPLKIEGIKGRNIYPDIVIVKNGKIKALLDLKMDLGWKRGELFNLAEKYSNLIKGINGKRSSLKVGETKEKLDFQISNNITYDIVIISDTNINKQLLANHLNKIVNLRPKIDIFILAKGDHPNAYNIPTKALLSRLIINKADFIKMFNKLNK